MIHTHHWLFVYEKSTISPARDSALSFFTSALYIVLHQTVTSNMKQSHQVTNRKIFLKNFPKPIDILAQVCYNSIIKGDHPEQRTEKEHEKAHYQNG
jgi:hypothetical protein